jgi:hypothetical protein
MQIQKQIEEAVERFIKEFEQRQDVFGPGIEKAILRDKFVTFLKKELSTIATKSAEESYKKALDDMFLEICKLAEPDERQPSAGDLNTHINNIHDIRVKLSKPKE